MDDDRVDHYLARVHHRVGVNLLGVLLPLLGLALGAGGLWLSDATRGAIPSWPAFFAIWIIPLVADLAWRHLRNPGYDATRYVYPFAGAALLYVPLWLWCAALPVVVAMIVLLHK